MVPGPDGTFKHPIYVILKSAETTALEKSFEERQRSNPEDFTEYGELTPEARARDEDAYNKKTGQGDYFRFRDGSKPGEEVSTTSVLKDLTKDGALATVVNNVGDFGDVFGNIFNNLLGGLGGGGNSGGFGGLVVGLAKTALGAKGGYVTKRGIQGFAGGGKVRGSKDTVPAMLTPGEYVLTPGQMRSMGQGSTIVNVNMGEGGGTTTSVKSDRAEAAKFGRAIASAVNHEIMKQKRAGGKLWMPGRGGI